MLVLKRKIETSFFLGDTIQVKVLGIEGDNVKLGIVAPDDVSILREELFFAIKEQDNIAFHLANTSESKAMQELRGLLKNLVVQDNKT